jgi:NAD+ synthase
MAESKPNEETMYSALVIGLRDYVQKNKFPGVVLGLSGGIDSALSAAIAVDALGADKVLGIRLPSPYSSKDSLEDADETAKLLGIRVETVEISDLMKHADAALKPLFAKNSSPPAGEARRGGEQEGSASLHAPLPNKGEGDTTAENIQARLRGLLLMAVSNKFGPMVLTTGNKSEMSVGYATLYGDMCGGFAVLKDVYKTTVYKLSRWRNTQGKVIPERTITKAPSAELRPNQTDQDSLPPYDTLDMILRGLIERQLSVRELADEGINETLVTRVAAMVQASEYKRRQSAPGVKITPMAFGRDRRWPITNKWKFQ